eukprot:129461-Pleurochrysis_carterae.AAC.2
MNARRRVEISTEYPQQHGIRTVTCLDAQAHIRAASTCAGSLCALAPCALLTSFRPTRDQRQNKQGLPKPNACC